MTKYDCSSADVNPIGGISKTDLKRFIAFAEKSFGLPILADFLDAVPTAELEPITEDYVQSDAVDMGMSYDDLSIYGRLRKVEKLGPYSMFIKLVDEWGEIMSPAEVRFIHLCRHLTRLTPVLDCGKGKNVLLRIRSQ